jgi:hypothetical protein
MPEQLSRRRALGALGVVSGPTDDDTFLRGVQVTNAKGIVEFLRSTRGGTTGGRCMSTRRYTSTLPQRTQMYFDEAVTDAVYANHPYSEHTGRDTFNDSDGIFDPGLTMTLAQDGDGYLGVMTFGVDAA